MIPIETIFDVFVDVNILLLLAFVLFSIARIILKTTGLKRAYTVQLQLLYFSFFAVIISPVVGLTFSQMLKSGMVDPGATFNLTDMVVAQYLQGNLQVKPALLEEVLGLRDKLTTQLFEFDSSAGIIILAIILSGVIFFSARFAMSIFVLRKVIRSAHVYRRVGNLDVLFSDTTLVPFSTRTFSKRYVVLPSNMLTNVRDMRMAVSHEFQHLRQFDLEWEFVVELLRPVFFWNPAYYLWKRQIEQLRELSCDQQVLARKGYDLKDYCACLLRVCQNSLTKNHMLASALPKVSLIETDSSLFGKNAALALQQRVNSLFDGSDQKPSKSLLFSLVVPLLAVIVFSTLAFQKTGDWSQDRLMLSTIINLERLAERNSLSKRY